VYVLDGRYMDDIFENGSEDSAIPSNDKTKDKVVNSKIGLFDTYWVGAQRWASESAKRNWLWSFIDKKEKEDHWFLIIDGDIRVMRQRKNAVNDFVQVMRRYVRGHPDLPPVCHWQSP